MYTASQKFGVSTQQIYTDDIKYNNYFDIFLKLQLLCQKE